MSSFFVIYMPFKMETERNEYGHAMYALIANAGYALLIRNPVLQPMSGLGKA